MVSLALVVGAVAVFLMMGGLGEGQQRCTVEECIEYPEHGSGTVVAYTALDPEKEPVTWSLDANSPDDALFEINGGRLTFKTPPDYEDPRDNGGNNVYEVTVIASAGSRTSPATPQRVEVTVKDLEEAGTVTLSTVQPKEGVDLRAMLSDPDGVTADSVTWQWARSTRASGPWTDIDRSEEAITAETDMASSYTPGYKPEDAPENYASDVGMYLRVTATYEDGHCGDACDPKKMAHVISANSVQAEDYANELPVFRDAEGVMIPEGERLERSIAENSPAGTEVGAPVTATDEAEFGPDVLTYSLGSDGDNLRFDIEPATGQIKVGRGPEPDFEDGDNDDQQYSVTVTATDSSGTDDSIGVTIQITDVDEAPTITARATTVTFNEIIDHTAPGQVGTDDYAATDPEDNPNALRWSLSGRDASNFTIGNGNDDRGDLNFKEAPNYEAPTDANRDNFYNVTVEVTDSGRNKATRDVIVEVININETAELTVSSRHPRVGVKITANLSDLDTPTSNLSWMWQANGALVSTSNTYTPKSTDSGNSLTVSVTYTDGLSATRSDVSTANLGNISGRNSSSPRPNFAKSTDERTVEENVAAPTSVGGPVTATDLDDNDLTYSISGADAAFFSIEQDTGQITVRAGTRLDREKKSSYRMTVTAEDPNGFKDTVSLTIKVTDVNEGPEITSGYGTVDYGENGTGTVGTYVAADPERKSIIWTLSGDDDDLFTIDGGLLKFKTTPDYEVKKDNDTDNTYEVTVEAGDGHNTLVEMEVEVIVTNVDEAGTVSGLPEGPKQDVAIPVILTDPDGTPEGAVAWQWARASSRTGTYIDIEENGNAASYVPTEEDVGMYLRVTANYTDPEGAGKSAHAISTRATERKDYSNDPPQFLDADGLDLPTTTRSVKENASPGTKVGAPVAATDIGRDGRQERLTYTLTGTDAASFTIDTTTGQIRVASGTLLDNETKPSYIVTVTATDPSDTEAAQSRDTIDVTINVENVDEAPIVTVSQTEGVTGNIDAGYNHDEPVGNSPTRMRIPFAGDDPEIKESSVNAAQVRWTLAGTDADDFSIGNFENAPGVLTFREGPDFEAPTDSNRKNDYEVMVRATDQGGNTVSKLVKVTVKNVEEAGTVTLTHTQPEVGTKLTASLTDPDRPSRVIWQWYRGNPPANNAACDAVETNNCRIGNATSASYTPVAGDMGTRLTVRVTYRDGHANGKMAAFPTFSLVKEKNEDNQAPQFQRDDSGITADEREVDEGKEPNPGRGRPGRGYGLGHG